MLSNETISNIRLQRETRLEPNKVPFVVQTAGTIRTIQPPKQQTTNNAFTGRTPTERAASSRSSKSAVDAKHRAINDSCMAAAIGDLQWLKQSVRDGPIGSGEITSIEETYGKEGLAPIHHAALHGRLNCLSYLVETVQIDIDAPSSVGWRPIHLCISKETGTRSYQCLQYLVTHGAKVNVTNSEQLTPLHQAASEGHVQCLELLLSHQADVYAEDNRQQLPIDLAKLWGHKKCAKLLAAAMWHQNKHLSAKERLVSRNAKMADILLEIKREHAILFEEKAEEKFDQWLTDIGTGSAVMKKSPEPAKPSSSTNIDLPPIHPESKEKIPIRHYPPTLVNLTRWNSSTHVEQNPYVPNLTDVYPRDPFTKMPQRADAVEIYRLLQTMTLNDVKKFLAQRQQPKTKKTKTNKSSERERRPVVYAACHVDDIQTLHKARKGDENFRPLKHFDESGLHMGDEARKSVFFRHLVEVLNDNEHSLKSQNEKDEERAKWALFEQYGPELVAFLKDRHGKFKKQFDKVFIT